MAEGLGRERWAHTSIICTLIANAHRDPKKTRPFKPRDFNPYLETKQHRPTVADKQSLSILKEALQSQKGNSHGLNHLVSNP
jgi:hypothetical protein